MLVPEVQEEKWEALGEGVGLFTDAAHRFGEDALLLADFARPRPGERCCDLGTGGGIIPFQWLAQGANNVIDGIDLDPEAIALARRSAALTARERQLAFHLADWRQLDRVLPAGEYGLTVCNPPYFPPGSGKVSRKDAAARARHEPSPDTLSRLAEAAARLLKNGGRFCLCHRRNGCATCWQRCVPRDWNRNVCGWFSVEKTGRPGCCSAKPIRVGGPD